jgi:hypothetical protein
MLSTPNATRGIKTMSIACEAAIIAQTGTSGAAGFDAAASAKCPSIMAILSFLYQLPVFA